ncbi:MAG: SDR family NAD(P)-dependent oxidoreductase [Pedobacter sp.]|uniref:SDR family NAD(P)-dependent oxidoreductase n=1 Tax=Pedobacter sp. TaxID=1411316 RepID=UPI002808DD48|nr:SDR family NAD(P)-dependent oxidoreductase [Pedobacter sp.]MDQ8004745.1 SDR family NAD(P)-dependent oxidoreductase [Pedobacter sp.]
MEKVLIITGGSKGIGKGIIDAYLANGVQIFSVSRSVNAELSKNGITQIELDLTHTDKLEAEFLKIFSLLDKESLSKITLINNAGTLGKIGPLEKLDAETIDKTIRLNTTVPFILSSLFIKYFRAWEAKKSIINITSGAALKPYFGWSVYCASKSAINMLTQTIAVEQADVKNGVKVLAIAPGVVDTDMQTEIRKSSKEDFKDIDRFVELKADGALNNVLTVGRKIFEMDHDYSLENGAILRVEGD